MSDKGWYDRPPVDLEYARAHKLLTIRGNPKLDRGAEAAGYWGAVLHLAPYTTVAGMNVCTEAGRAQCYAACLWRAGRGGLRPIMARGGTAYARYQRTAWYGLDPVGFIERLEHEVNLHIRRARKVGLTPFIRLNGTSDIRWEVDHPDMIRRIIDSGGLMMDYTKHADRSPPDGYSLIWSHSEAPGYRDGLKAAMNRYGRAAVVFRIKPGTATRPGGPLPEVWRGYPVADGDKHDMWWQHPRGSVVGLRLKGRHAWARPTTLAVTP